MSLNWANFNYAPGWRLTNVQRGRALALLDEAIGQREVARRLQVSHSVIERLSALHENKSCPKKGTVLVSSGYQQKKNPYLVLSVLRERSATSVTLRGQLRDATGKTPAAG